ncbi:E3 ubiquitin-protein ligase complex slx8-rfp subunit slx8 [Smittium mucronatum]|uniref:E3 ubiquitin-protein ligase complex slx8-rfp subunit slx8 n=1 Tax=Smittium mucronatum TaxID=133383 RepID=A0A1R0H1M7_9FUNG|nr:E3 ubiquitin-protein ligase complex slx8-rfp subunit slx8 [Smittium mucronatum]
MSQDYGKRRDDSQMVFNSQHTNETDVIRSAGPNSDRSETVNPVVPLELSVDDRPVECSPKRRRGLGKGSQSPVQIDIPSSPELHSQPENSTSQTGKAPRGARASRRSRNQTRNTNKDKRVVEILDVTPKSISIDGESFDATANQNLVLNVDDVTQNLHNSDIQKQKDKVLPGEAQVEPAENQESEDPNTFTKETSRGTDVEFKRRATFKCMICLDSPVDSVLNKSCGHVFCENCIMTSIIASKKCPVCRKNLTEKTLISFQFLLGKRAK